MIDCAQMAIRPNSRLLLAELQLEQRAQLPYDRRTDSAGHEFAYWESAGRQVATGSATTISSGSTSAANPGASTSSPASTSAAVTGSTSAASGMQVTGHLFALVALLGVLSWHL
jgi:hypothetical protein